MNSLTRRVGALERVVEERTPCKPSVVVLIALDGTASVDGITYATIEEAKAAHPSPSGLYVECGTYDASKPRSAREEAGGGHG